jgi:hypothetical protein
MTSIDSQLTILEQTVNSKMSETEADVARRKAQEAKLNVEIARANEKDAPSNTRKAELEYALALNPTNPQSVLRTYYQTEAGTIREKWVATVKEKIGQLADSAIYLQSQNTYIQSVTPATEGFTNKEIDNTDTIYRKSELYSKQNSLVLIWITIMNCIILAYAIVLLYDLRSNLLDPRVGITIALTFASVFILDKMVYALYKLPSYLIQYIGWGADEIHTTAWLYLYVPLVAILLYIIIYNLII